MVHLMLLRAEYSLHPRFRRLAVGIGHHLIQELRGQSFQPPRELLSFALEQPNEFRFRARLGFFLVKALPRARKVESCQRGQLLLSIHLFPYLCRDGHMRQHLRHASTLWRRYMSVLRLRNVLRHLNRVLANRPKPARQLFSAIRSHARPPCISARPTRTGRHSLRCPATTVGHVLFALS